MHKCKLIIIKFQSNGHRERLIWHPVAITVSNTIVQYSSQVCCNWFDDCFIRVYDIVKNYACYFKKVELKYCLHHHDNKIKHVLTIIQALQTSLLHSHNSTGSIEVKHIASDWCLDNKSGTITSIKTKLKLDQDTIWKHDVSFQRNWLVTSEISLYPV